MRDIIGPLGLVLRVESHSQVRWDDSSARPMVVGGTPVELYEVSGTYAGTTYSVPHESLHRLWLLELARAARGPSAELDWLIEQRNKETGSSWRICCWYGPSSALRSVRFKVEPLLAVDIPDWLSVGAVLWIEGTNSSIFEVLEPHAKMCLVRDHNGATYAVETEKLVRYWSVKELCCDGKQ